MYVLQMDNVTKELKTNNMKLKGLVTSVSLVVELGPTEA